MESLRKPWQYNLGTLENLLQCNLGNLEGTFTIQPWEPWKTWEPSGNLEETLKEPWGYLLGTLREPWQSNLGNLLETFTISPWEPGPRLLGNLYIIILGTLTTFTWKTWDPCREPWRNLEGTFWEPFGNREGTLRNLGNLGNLERTLRTLGTLSEPWEPWEPLLGNLYLGTWEPLLGNLGTFTWEPLLGTWEPWGNGFWSCSGLLRNLYYGWRPQSILLLGNILSILKRKMGYPTKSFSTRSRSFGAGSARSARSTEGGPSFLGANKTQSFGGIQEKWSEIFT